jgi:hypothetical protein
MPMGARATRFLISTEPSIMGCERASMCIFIVLTPPDIYRSLLDIMVVMRCWEIMESMIFYVYDYIYDIFKINRLEEMKNRKDQRGEQRKRKGKKY